MTDFAERAARAFAFLEGRGFKSRHKYESVLYENGPLRIRISLDRGPEVVVTFEYASSKFDLVEVAGLLGCDAPGLMGEVDGSLERAAGTVAALPGDAFAPSPEQLRELSARRRAGDLKDELAILRGRIARSRAAGNRPAEIELLAELGERATPAEAARLRYLRRREQGS